VAGYACADFHPWPRMPRGYDRPISEWTIAEFVHFMARECGPTAARQIRISIN